MNTNKTLVVAACGIALTSLAWAQGKPAEKPEHEHMMGKPGENAEHEHMMGKPGEKAEHEHMGKPGEMGAPAQGTAAPGAPKPPPELDAAFKFFDGMWKCETKMPAGSMGPGSPEMTSKSTVRFRKVMHGFYYQGEYELKKTKTTPGYKGSFLISYQPAAKLFVITSSDEMGGAEYATSLGFTGDTVTFLGEGYMMGQKMKIRETMTKNDKQAGHKYEVDMGKGFQPMGEDNCTR
jgi:hypothetical protein